MSKKTLNPAKPKKGKTKTQKKFSSEWLRIEDFFMILGREGPSAELWKMLKLALIVDNDYIDERDRSNMIFLYENAKILFEDVFSLLKKQRRS